MGAVNGLGADPSADSWQPWTAMQFDGQPAWQLGDGVDVWRSLATGSTSPRTEIIHEAHNTTGNGTEDGNGQAIRVGDYKLITEKGPMWHGPPNDLWYESDSNPSNYTHVIECGGPFPNGSETDYCHPDKLPCLFNIREDPCEFHDLSKKMPQKVAELKQRLLDYQSTAVEKDFHKLRGCDVDSSPKKHPKWNNTWMPYCPLPSQVDKDRSVANYVV